MWNCKACGAQIENDSWDNCWNCSTNRHDFDPDAVGQAVERDVNLDEFELNCLRCGELMQDAGTADFHEGTNFGVPGILGEMFVGRKGFDLLVCGGC